MTEGRAFNLAEGKQSQVLSVCNLILSGRMGEVLSDPDRFRGAVDAQALQLFLLGNPDRDDVELLFNRKRELLSPNAITNELAGQINLSEIGKASLYFILASLLDFPAVDRSGFVSDLRKRAVSPEERDKVEEIIGMVHERYPEEMQGAQELSPVDIFEQTQTAVGESATGALAVADQEARAFSAESADVLRGIEDPSLRERIEGLNRRAMEFVGEFARNVVAFVSVTSGDDPMLLSGQGEATAENDETETFEEMIARANDELARNGITREQRGAYRPIVNDLLYRAITPCEYSIPNALLRLIPNLISGKHLMFNSRLSGREDTPKRMGRRLDAWGLYLGIPQKNDTFGISMYKPNGVESRGNEEYCYRIKDFWRNYSKYRSEWGDDDFSYSMRGLVGAINRDGGRFIDTDVYADIMGEFSFTGGKDERGSYIEYDDIWDLNVSIEREKGFFGKPFHIYDRLYYDPITFEPILE